MRADYVVFLEPQNQYARPHTYRLGTLAALAQHFAVREAVRGQGRWHLRRRYAVPLQRQMGSLTRAAAGTE
eukprot:1552087-Pyramimonas_sp.AAC.1